MTWVPSKFLFLADNVAFSDSCTRSEDFGTSALLLYPLPEPSLSSNVKIHVVHLHRIARTHTPTSIESPLPIQLGIVEEGEDPYALLQDYALCSPSQRLRLKVMYLSYTSGTKAVLPDRGCPQLMRGEDKTGRSLLFRIDGQHVTTAMIRNTIAADG